MPHFTNRARAEQTRTEQTQRKQTGDEGVLALRFGNDANEFWLRGENEFPFLAKASFAAEEFFDEQKQPGSLDWVEL